MVAWAVFLAFGALLSAFPAQAQRADNGFLIMDNPNRQLVMEQPKPLIAPTPPMGWNSWYGYKCDIDEAKIRAAAEFISSSGLKDAGYTYVNVDDCWQAPKRDAMGNLQADPVRFPSGIKALADFVHSKGLKFGIYSDAGTKTCGKFPGSAGHEYQDARLFASWGVDLLKYDWCYTGPMNAEAAYTIMAMALRETGRDIVFSICEWGMNEPEKWAPAVGHMWRTHVDIDDKWDVVNSWWQRGIVNMLDHQVGLAKNAGPHQWNDPDPLQVGLGGMTTTEYESQMSLWSLLAAPLMMSFDPQKPVSADTLRILGNKDVIRVNQDPLGKPGDRIFKQGDLEIWARPLADGEHAVVLFNRSAETRSMKISWAQLNLPPAMRTNVQDLWSKKIFSNVEREFSASVASHGVVMIRITPIV
ncbi:MAG: glycoside hydrolase family 27 protein [Blastomonas sp.]|nr:glycoside hydrolase family 27 protein [Blastomonas sp.]